MKKSLIFIIATILPVLAWADTHYVTKAGGGSACTQGSPCLTIAAGIASMVGGDTLVVGDGTYTNDPITGVPSGSAGAWTTVQAENVGGVTIDMSSGGDWDAHGITTSSTDQYIQFEGFKVKGSLTAWSNGVIYSTGDYIKFFRVATYNARQSGNTASFVIGTGSDHVLVEECWSWGTGRYKFIAYETTNVIFRRCVSRHDYNTDIPGGEGLTQQATFVNYDSTNTLFQNCIAIDSGVHGSGQEIYGGFWDENNANVSKTGKITGSIVLNFRTNHGGMTDKVSGTRGITNSVIWDSGGGWIAIMRGAASYTPTITLDQNTIGVLLYEMTNVYDSYGVAVGSTGNWNATTTNSILYNAYAFGVSDYMQSNYNVLYANHANYGGPNHTPTPGANDRTDINPLTSGLMYLPRIESGSYLKTGGSGGGRIGAEILYQHGTSGTLYGETGYDTLTAVQLWPFPNEALIKSDFASYSGPGPAGARGFATGNSIDNTPQTLTKYIWEYLGNQIPADIYGPDTTPAAFSFTDQTGVALGSTNNSDNVTVTGIDNETTLALTGDASCKYSINGAAWATADDNVALNDNVALQNVASSSYFTAVSCTLNLGGVTDTWSRTTLAAIESPVAPRFKGASMSGGWR